jgi:hypothetical protein
LQLRRRCCRSHQRVCTSTLGLQASTPKQMPKRALALVFVISTMRFAKRPKVSQRLSNVASGLPPGGPQSSNRAYHLVFRWHKPILLHQCGLFRRSSISATNFRVTDTSNP